MTLRWREASTMKLSWLGLHIKMIILGLIKYEVLGDSENFKFSGTATAFLSKCWKRLRGRHFQVGAQQSGSARTCELAGTRDPSSVQQISRRRTVPVCERQDSASLQKVSWPYSFCWGSWARSVALRMVGDTLSVRGVSVPGSKSRRHQRRRYASSSVEAECLEGLFYVRLYYFLILKRLIIRIVCLVS